MNTKKCPTCGHLMKELRAAYCPKCRFAVRQVLKAVASPPETVLDKYAIRNDLPKFKGFRRAETMTDEQLNGQLAIINRRLGFIKNIALRIELVEDLKYYTGELKKRTRKNRKRPD